MSSASTTKTIIGLYNQKCFKLFTQKQDYTSTRFLFDPYKKKMIREWSTHIKALLKAFAQSYIGQLEVRWALLKHAMANRLGLRQTK